MKYRLIASDVDGTLLNTGSQLTERTKKAIIHAVNAGILFVTATGRPFCNIKIINELFAEDMPFIVFNGSAAYMGKSKKLLFEKYLGFEPANEAFEIGNKLGVAQVVWTSSQLWCNRVCEETTRYRDFSTTPSMDVVTDLNELKGKVPGISKVLWITDPEIVRAKQHEMKSHFQGKLNCYTSMPPFLEFVSLDASKGAALAEAGKLFGVERNGMMAIGDAHNDVSMLEYAGFSVAMGNAADDIKEICSYVTLTNDEDGAADAIEKFAL